MHEQEQAKFNGWAIVELFGHTREAGFVATEYYGSAAMFRIDVPGLPEREWVLEKPERGDNYQLLPVGTKVKRAAVPSRSRLVGPGAVYSLNPCTEEVARTAIERGIQRPLIVLEMPQSQQLTTGSQADQDDQHDDYMEPEYDDEETDDLPV